MPVEAEWFRPHYEFRFPASRHHRRARRRARAAAGAGAVARARRGRRHRRHRALRRFLARAGAGQGRGPDRRPLRRDLQRPHRAAVAGTGVPGEAVAGVRFRAWGPPSALHPTIGVHSPLVFDIVDTWSGRSVAGCRYHVGHPGGRNYETFPVNAYEAEGRRLSPASRTSATPPGPIATKPARDQSGLSR